ncbi:phosphatidyl synthase [Peziza echinospora]|nr:phosphatidyl synthase [Peziza echinospora]
MGIIRSNRAVGCGYDGSILLARGFRAASVGGGGLRSEQQRKAEELEEKEKTVGKKSSILSPKSNLPPPLTHEKVLNIPNILTFSRLFASPIIGYLVLHSHYPAALALLITAGLTDLLDGHIARKYNLQTVVGSVIDPMADKTLMTILTITLAAQGLLPLWLAVIILGRDVGLAISAIYYRYISLPPPKTFARYWDFSLPSAEVRPTMVSKINTVLQMGLITACTAFPVVTGAGWVGAEGLGEVLVYSQYLVAATTVWSGLSYVGSKSAVKILHQPPTAEERVREEVEGVKREGRRMDQEEEERKAKK